MIGKLQGLVDSIYKEQAIINVSGVGYIVSCSLKTISKMKIGKPIQLFVDTQMKESQITLYGFYDINEKDCFLKLVTIKGLGPKLALTILSALTADQVSMSIIAKDKDIFKSISGVGSKIVSRLFTELKATDFCFERPLQEISAVDNQNASLKEDAISALINLGVNRVDAYSIVSKILLSNPDMDLNTLIKESLSKVNG